MIDERRRQELLLEHNDERLTDGGLDFAISACSDVEKSQDNYCTICCTISENGHYGSRETAFMFQSSSKIGKKTRHVARIPHRRLADLLRQNQIRLLAIDLRI